MSSTEGTTPGGSSSPGTDFYAKRRARLLAEIRSPVNQYLPPDDQIEHRIGEAEFAAWEASRPMPVAFAWLQPLTLLRDAWELWDDVLATASAYPAAGEDEALAIEPEVLRLIAGAHEQLGYAAENLTGTAGSEGNDPVLAIEEARAAEGFMLAVRWGYGWMVPDESDRVFPPEVFQRVCIAVDSVGPAFGDRFAALVAKMRDGGLK